MQTIAFENQNEGNEQHKKNTHTKIRICKLEAFRMVWRNAMCVKFCFLLHVLIRSCGIFGSTCIEMFNVKNTFC